MHFLATLLAAFILLGIASATPVARDVKMCYPKQTWGAGRANILLEKNNLERWALNATVAHGKVSRVYSVKAHTNTNSYLTSTPPFLNIRPIDSTVEYELQIAGGANTTLCLNGQTGRWTTSACSDTVKSSWLIYCSCPEVQPNPFCHFIVPSTGKCVTYNGRERPLTFATCGPFESSNVNQAWQISIESGYN